MTTEVLVPWLTQQFFASNGTPLAGGLLYTYQAGTSTPVATYIDSTGVTTNSNPVVANSRGEMSVWITPNVAYKFVLTDSVGNTIWTRDQVTSSQLLTLFGGTDTGSSSLYLLTFLTPFSTYAAMTGNPIFFIPANNNLAGASININGIGVVGLYNGNGTVLGANQILAGYMTEIVYQTNIAGSGNSGFVLLPGTSLTGSVIGTFGQEVPLASAATTDLGTVPAHTAQITGTTTITSFGSSASTLAPYYLLRFSGAMQLTYNATSMILPGATNIITAAGDSAIAQYLGSGNWRIAFYQYANSTSSANSKMKPSDTSITSNATLTADPDLQTNLLGVGRYTWEVLLIFDSVTAAAGFKWTNGGTAVDSRGVAPGTLSGFVNGAAVGPANGSPYGATISYATVSTAAYSNIVLYKGSLLVSTVGTFGVNWAQATLTASATTLRGGSYLTVNLQNTGASAGTITRIYQTPGSFTETIPTGYTTLTLEVWGGSGGGGGGYTSGMIISGGGGGASGAYARSSISVLGLGGDTVTFTVGAAGIAAGAGGASSCSGGTLPYTAISCAGGAAGINSVGPGGGAGGAGGAATGGNVVNTAGNSGTAGQSNIGGQLGGPGGFGIAGINDGGNSGGAGHTGSGAGAPGGVGIVCFNYS